MRSKLMQSEIRSNANFSWQRLLAALGIFFLLNTECIGQQRDLMADAVRAAVESASRYVVQIETIGGLEQVDGVQTGSGPSTGVIVSEDGYILSSSTNLAHQPSSVFVRIGAGNRMPAEVVARDKSRNLVLLKVKTSERLPVPETGARKDLKVGQTAIALGKSYDSQNCNVSLGIISAKDRIWGRAIQTDAKISPNNYGGPLIDLQGRVLGILVPLAMDSEADLAGTDWYDSGIGFAVPLDEIMSRMDDLKTGTNLRAGKMGVVLQGADIYADPAIVAVCAGGSPAAEAGLRVDDEIVQVNSNEINRQAQLKHVIGPLYARDAVELELLRGEKRLTIKFDLVAEVDPFQPVQLGLIPGTTGMQIGHVIENGPAAVAGVKPDDELVSVLDETVDSWDQVRQLMWSRLPGQSVPIGVMRNGRKLEFELVLTPMSALIDEQFASNKKTNTVTGKCIKRAVSLTEFENRCFAIVPEQLDTNSNPSLLVWLAPPGKIEEARLMQLWQTACLDRNMIVLVPQPSDAKKWEPDESEFVRNVTLLMQRDYQLDENRIAIGGSGTGGAMACLVAKEFRSLYRGLIVVDSLIPDSFETLESTTQSLLILAAASEQFEEAEQLAEQIDKLRRAFIPAALESGVDSLEKWVPRPASWIDALNRI